MYVIGQATQVHTVGKGGLGQIWFAHIQIEKIEATLCFAHIGIDQIERILFEIDLCFSINALTCGKYTAKNIIHA